MEDNFRKSPGDEEGFKFDSIAHAVTTITENHRLIHDGMFFSGGHYEASVGGSDTLDLLISVPAGVFPHLQSGKINASDGDLFFRAYEGTTTSDDGTAVTMFNRNRNSANTMQSTVTHTPTVSAVGTEITSAYIPDPGFLASGVLFDERESGEVVLAPSTKYLLRIENNAVAAREIQFSVGIYEVSYET